MATEGVVMGEQAPIVIGATGGSGTRVIHGMVQRAGADMGRRLNVAGDAQDFEPFLDGYINPILQETRRLDYDLDELSPSLRSEASSEFENALAVYRADIPSNAHWGWKNPRIMYVLPVIHGILPDFRFIHLVRDGREMAFSLNQHQLRKHYSSLFDRELNGTMEVSTAQLWATANLQVARWSERNLGPRYFRLRFEDLCDNPLRMTRQLVEHFDLPGRDLHHIAQLVEPPETLNRWQKAPSELIGQITAAAEDGLASFGYLDS